MFFYLIFFIMSKLSTLQPSKTKINHLQLKFFIANNSQVGNSATNKKQNSKIQTSRLQKQQCVYQNIDPSLLNYRHHYFKDIQTRFPTDQIVDLLISPKIITKNIQLRSIFQWREMSTNRPQCIKYWFPLFFSHQNPHQYFQQSLELIVIIIQKNNQYLGFLGYVPHSLILYNIFLLLAQFYDIQITDQTCFCTELSNQFSPIDQLRYITVGQAQGKYIKVCSEDKNFYQKRQPNKNIVSELPDLIDLNEVQQQNHYPDHHHQQIQSQLTNHAALSQNWHSNMQIQTNFEQKNQFRSNLITNKTQQQIKKIKNRGKLCVENASIKIPDLSEESMMESLGFIIQQLQNNLRLT